MKARLAVLVLGVLLPMLAFGAPITIDAFGTTQTVSVSAGGANPVTTVDTVAAADAIGGFRTIEVTRFDGTGATSSAVNIGANGLLEVNVGANDLGQAVVEYDGDALNGFSPDGFGPIDLTDGGLNAGFRVLTRSDLGNIPFQIVVWSGVGGGEVSDASFLVASTGFDPNPFTDNFVSFASFSPLAGGGADFTDIRSIRLVIGDGVVSGFDVQVASVTASPIPEPTTMMLTGLGLLGAALLARRRRSS